MSMLTENKFGYLSLFDLEREQGVLVKANKITAITHSVEDESGDIGSVVCVDGEAFYVKETMDQILEQLENIHPNML